MVDQCGCDDTSGYRTLAELRDDMMRMLGYSLQIASPPPGMTELLNSFLTHAHKTLVPRARMLETERWFTWNLATGQRIYALDANAERTAQPACDKTFDPYRVSYVGIRRGATQVPLVHGIPSALLVSETSGVPSHYEIRNCLEVAPAPSDSDGILVIRAHAKPVRFTEDTDRPSVPDELVFLFALSNAKSHYGKPDAGAYMQQMEVLLTNMVAGTHGTRRYVTPDRRRYRGAYSEPRPEAPFE
jgi:hypothetical protein